MPGSQRRGARGPGGGRCAGPVGAWPRGVYRGAGGVRSSGGPGGCGSRHPGTREPAWVSLALGERGASFGKLPGRVSPWGTGSGFGVCVFSTASLLDPRLGARRRQPGRAFLTQVGGLPAPVPPAAWLSTPGRVGSSSGTWLACSRAAQRQSWEDSSGQ